MLNEKAFKEIADQEKFMADRGKDLAGYILTYGSAKSPEHQGDGGEAIFAADQAQLDKLIKAVSPDVYGRWSGCPNGIPARPRDCVVFVSGERAVGGQCGSKRGSGPAGLLCRRHAAALTVRANKDKERADNQARDTQIKAEGQALIDRLGAKASVDFSSRNFTYNRRLIVDFETIEQLLDYRDRFKKLTGQLDQAYEAERHARS